MLCSYPSPPLLENRVQGERRFKGWSWELISHTNWEDRDVDELSPAPGTFKSITEWSQSMLQRVKWHFCYKRLHPTFKMCLLLRSDHRGGFFSPLGSGGVYSESGSRMGEVRRRCWTASWVSGWGGLKKFNPLRGLGGVKNSPCGAFESPLRLHVSVPRRLMYAQLWPHVQGSPFEYSCVSILSINTHIPCSYKPIESLYSTRVLFDTVFIRTHSIHIKTYSWVYVFTQTVLNRNTKNEYNKKCVYVYNMQSKWKYT